MSPLRLAPGRPNPADTDTATFTNTPLQIVAGLLVLPAFIGVIIVVAAGSVPIGNRIGATIVSLSSLVFTWFLGIRPHAVMTSETLTIVNLRTTVVPLEDIADVTVSRYFGGLFAGVTLQDGRRVPIWAGPVPNLPGERWRGHRVAERIVKRLDPTYPDGWTRPSRPPSRMHWAVNLLSVVLMALVVAAVVVVGSDLRNTPDSAEIRDGFRTWSEEIDRCVEDAVAEGVAASDARDRCAASVFEFPGTTKP